MKRDGKRCVDVYGIEENDGNPKGATISTRNRLDYYAVTGKTEQKSVRDACNNGYGSSSGTSGSTIIITKKKKRKIICIDINYDGKSLGFHRGGGGGGGRDVNGTKCTCTHCNLTRSQ